MNARPSPKPAQQKPALDWRCSWAQWGIIAIVIPYFVIGLMNPYVFMKSAPTFAGEYLTFTGRVELSPDSRNGRRMRIRLETQQTIGLTCSAPMTVECYPGAWTDEGETITVDLATSNHGELTLRRVARSGQVIADEAYFDKKLQERMLDGRRFLVLSNILGAVLLLGSMLRARKAH